MEAQGPGGEAEGLGARAGEDPRGRAPGPMVRGVPEVLSPATEEVREDLEDLGWGSTTSKEGRRALVVIKVGEEVTWDLRGARSPEYLVRTRHLLERRELRVKEVQSVQITRIRDNITRTFLLLE